MGNVRSRKIKKRGLRVLCFLFLLCAYAPAAENIVSQLAADRKAGVISRIQELEYFFFSAFSPALLPAQYRGLPQPDQGPRCLTPLMWELRANWNSLSETARELYRKQEELPGDSKTYTTPGGHFQIYYYTSGNNAVPSLDANSNSLPDYLELVAAAFDSSWRKEIEGMGLRQPRIYSPPWGAAEDLWKYKVALIKLAGGYYGFTLPGESGSGTFIQLRNNYDGFKIANWKGDTISDYGQNPAGAVNTTAAHELFHAIQMTYVNDISICWSWNEGSAVFMEETVYPDVNDYYQYIQDFFWLTDQPLDYEGSANDVHGYATCVWPLYLAKRHGSAIIKSIWTKMEALENQHQLSPYAYNAMDSALAGVGASLAASYAEFASWCYFTRNRADSINYFAEAGLYPPVKFFDSINVVRPTESLSGTVERMAFKYFRLVPDEIPARIVEFKGKNQYGTAAGIDWQVFAVGFDSTHGIPPKIFRMDVTGTGEASAAISEWNLYSEIGLAVVNANTLGRQSFQFSVIASEYDTVRLAAGECLTLTKPRAGFSLRICAGEPVQTIFELTPTTTNPDSSRKLGAVSFEKYFGICFTPNIDSKLTEAEVIISFDAADLASLARRGVRPEELAGYAWDETAKTWIRRERVRVAYSDSTLRFFISKMETVGLFRDQSLSYTLRSYPSPADFRRYPKIYFSSPAGIDLCVYGYDGTLVRTLSARRAVEYEVNRFVWDGKNQNGSPARSGPYYFVARDSTQNHFGKLMLLR